MFSFYHTHILCENSIHLHTKCHSAGSPIWCRDKTCILPKTENKEHMIHLYIYIYIKNCIFLYQYINGIIILISVEKKTHDVALRNVVNF